MTDNEGTYTFSHSLIDLAVELSKSFNIPAAEIDEGEKRLPQLADYGMEYKGDLLYYDGPILSMFEHVKTQRCFLLYWAGDDDEFIHWLSFELKDEHKKGFYAGEMSLRDIFFSNTEVCVLYMNGIVLDRVHFMRAVCVPWRCIPGWNSYLTSDMIHDEEVAKLFRDSENATLN